MSRSTSMYGSSNQEINLRSEFDQMMTGTSGEIAKKQSLILRKMRRDDDDQLIDCACKDPLTKEADTESSCLFCLGEGYYWDETWIYGYSQYVGSRNNHANRRIGLQPGLVSAYDKVYYIYYNTDITYDDKIIEMKLDSEGNPTVPYTRKFIFRPESLMEMRSDNGRIEFITIYVNEHNGLRVK